LGCGESGGLACVFGGDGFVGVSELVEEHLADALGAVGEGDLGDGGEVAVGAGGVGDDLGDGVDEVFGGEWGEVGAGLGRQVEAGDLEAVEEQAGAAGIEGVGGEALEDEADGGLDGAAILGEGELEGGLGGVFAGERAGLGSANGVVVVAEVLVGAGGGGLEGEQGGAAAAAAVGEDVSALEQGRCRHRYPPSRGEVLKSRKQTA
jgi:hypothetical protein